MNKIPLNRDDPADQLADAGSATVEQVRARAREIALLAGHGVGHVTPADYEQAKREMMDEPAQETKETLLEAAPESDRWNPVPGSPGHRAPETPPEDEDVEGRSETEQLVNQGVEDAERDQMVQAARAASRKDLQSL
jgi:nucleotide-binding universal stress UspA family protein